MLYRSISLALCLSFAGCSATVAGDVTADGDPVGGDPDITDPNGTPEQLCEADFANVTLDPVPPTVHLLVDMSGSMRRDFTGVSRWDATRYALVDGTDGIVSRLADRIYFGATLYYSDDAHSGSDCAVLSTESPQLANAGRIRQLIDEGNPRDDTPTAEAIDAIAAGFIPAVPSSRKFLVLATDGDPDQCTNPDAHGLESQILTENAVDRAFAAGVSTLVLSVGNDITREHLRRTANLGAGRPAHTGMAPYYVANNPNQLITELESLVAATLPTCSFNLSQPLAFADVGNAHLDLEGSPISYGTDWKWVDENTIELLGAACARVMADPTLSVLGEIPCVD